LKSKKVFIIAIILGIITIVALNYYITDANSETPTFAPVELVSVVMAKATIHQHTRITEDMLITKKIPSEAVHPEAILNIGEAAGGISRSDIMRDEQVLSSRVVTDDIWASLSYRVPEQYRAISIPMNEVSGVSGFISPNDKVDVLVTYDNEDINEMSTTYTVIQNAIVMAVGKATRQRDDEETQLVNTITLLVTPGQAEVLAYATRNGYFHFTLRSPLDGGKAALDYYNPDNFETFRER